MVEYSDEDVIEAPRAVVWKLLADHLDEAKIVEIHPLIRSQKIVRQSGNEVVVDRVIDVNRKLKKSRWRMLFQPPDHARWEVLESEGPWASGSYLDLTYLEDGKKTRVRARGALTVMNLPFFLSQARTVRSVLNDLQTEDVWFLRRYRY